MLLKNRAVITADEKSPSAQRRGMGSSRVLERAGRAWLDDE